MNPEVCIIILNWNGWKDTVECLESLYQNKYDNYKVILVDNASEDESLEKIAEYCQGRIELSSTCVEYQRDNKPLSFIQIDGEEVNRKFNTLDYKLLLIKNRENQGFAIGNNIGMRFALNNFNPDFFLLLNNDTVL
ncbi:MAG TPA: glycosyltransferase, partial [Methanobacterium sp.]|nr:glycosyltransferase [Methanobacterium sp.]